jgi:hypothetical protein
VRVDRVGAGLSNGYLLAGSLIDLINLGYHWIGTRLVIPTGTKACQRATVYGSKVMNGWEKNE